MSTLSRTTIVPSKESGGSVILWDCLHAWQYQKAIPQLITQMLAPLNIEKCYRVAISPQMPLQLTNGYCPTTPTHAYMCTYCWRVLPSNCTGGRCNGPNKLLQKYVHGKNMPHYSGEPPINSIRSINGTLHIRYPCLDRPSRCTYHKPHSANG